MRWILNLSTKAKLSLAFSIMILLLAGLTLLSYSNLASIRASQRSVNDSLTDAVILRDVRADQNGTRANLLAMMLAQSAERDALREDTKRRTMEVVENLNRLVSRNTDDSTALAKLREYQSAQAEFQRVRESQVIPAILAGRAEDARRFIFGTQAEQDRKQQAIVQAFMAETEQRVQAAAKHADEVIADAERTFVIFGIVAVVAVLIIVMTLNWLIANPLKQMSSIAERIAAKDLTVTLLPQERTDEVGVLAQNFQRMVENLRATNREVQEGVNVLVSSGSEILAVTTQLASSSAETAAAVSQTTTTVEEIKQTAQLSSQKAKYVSDTAQKSAQISNDGSKAVESLLESIHHIEGQMESIADGILKLSEQSQAIGEIIATVNDLAEQSNLLAVNAAIEAAKAGEHGKGFAVVSQEIKSLAEQSKQSASQVRAILNDIQKATTSAVMATEQGTKAVEGGTKTSAEVGESIRLLAESIAECAQAAIQIAASAQQQFVGIDQVALAMQNIKQASTQNVTGTRQTEVAAQNLHELGGRLKQMAGQYRV